MLLYKTLDDCFKPHTCTQSSIVSEGTVSLDAVIFFIFPIVSNVLIEP